MPNKYQPNVEYFLVEGWFEKSNGLHDGSFYGAYCHPSQLLLPIRCVIAGKEAILASQRASIQEAKVLSRELREETKADGEYFDDDRPPVSHVKFQDLEITIENPVGSVRSGVSKDGHAWETKMKNSYGFLKRVNGADGEGVDVFLGPNAGAKFVYVVHQNNPESGQFDEDKVMLGFDTAETARKSYLAHYDNDDYFGSLTTIPIDTFKEAVNSKSDEFRWKSKTPQTGIKIEEMFCSGAIAERPNVLGGTIGMKPPEILGASNNRPRRRKKPKMPHSNKIGSRIPTISQSGGTLGGNPQ